MSISGSLSNALSGLNAAARAAEVVSSNVSNSLTDGYGRRSLGLATNTNGGGVNVVGVQRHTDQRVITERRLAEAELGDQTIRSTFHQDLEAAIGLPEDPGSLTGRVAGLEAALLEASSRPDSETRLNEVLRSAEGLANHIRNISDDIQGMRLEADADIANQVDALNGGLSRIEALNHEIRIQKGAGRDAAALIDQRQQQIDKISEIVPLKEIDRAHGQVALFTPGGAILLDGNAAFIEFAAVGTIVPEMTRESGALSGLTVNGQPLAASNATMNGGSLSALFDVRGNLAIKAQTQLDGVARDLVERFADTTTDPTLAPGAPGLFTDSGASFLPADEVGLSSRLSINSLVQPDSGGATWRLRDGLGAVVPGDVGNSAGLSRLVDALTATRVPASGGFMGAGRTASGLASVLLSNNHADLSAAQAEESFMIGKFEALKIEELRDGVDTDHEMQQLLLVEQAYAANARVISTVDEMIQTLLGL